MLFYLDFPVRSNWRGNSNGMNNCNWRFWNALFIQIVKEVGDNQSPDLILWTFSDSNRYKRDNLEEYLHLA